MTDKPPIRLHVPPGINFGFIERAVEIVVETCSPKAVYLVGPTSVGYVEHSCVELLVVVDEGDPERVCEDINRALARVLIDGDVRVYTSDEFEEYRTDSCTAAYRAVEYGRLAYERASEKKLIDSGDAFYEHVMEVAPRVGRKSPDGMIVLPADWDDPGDEIYSAMDADKTPFACILGESIIRAVF